MRQLALHALCFACFLGTARAAIVRVDQGTSGLGVTCTASTGTTQTCTLSQAPLSGSALIAFVSFTGSISVSSISGGGVTWAKASVASNGSSNRVEIWYGLNSSGSGTSITITSGTITSVARTTVVEFSGVKTSGALDASDATGNSGTSVNPATNSITPTASQNEVIVALEKTGVTNLSAGPTNSFTALNTLSVSMQPAYRIVTSTSGSYSTDWTFGSSSWAATIDSFVAATVAATPHSHAWVF